MVKIERGIPRPPEKRRVAKSKYQFGKMMVDDSFALPRSEADRVGYAARVYKNRHPGWDYQTLRTETEIRLWRVS
jgi:hypothetical protein